MREVDLSVLADDSPVGVIEGENVEYEYTLRPDVVIELVLPVDLSDEERERLMAFMAIATGWCDGQQRRMRYR